MALHAGPDMTALAETANRASTHREAGAELVAASQPEKLCLGQDLHMSPLATSTMS